MFAFTKDIAGKCPENYPQGFVKWIREELLPEDRVLLYKKGNVKGFCYACHSHVEAASYAERFSQQKTYPSHCPKCGQHVLPVLEGGTLWSADYIRNVATVQKDRRGIVWIRHFHVLRNEVFTPDRDIKEICRWAIYEGKVLKWMKEVNERMGWSSMSRCVKVALTDWTDVSSVTEVFDGSYEFYLPRNWRNVLSGTCLQYLDLEEYLNFDNRVVVNNALGSYVATYKNVIRHMVDWARYPAVEKLWKSGFSTLVLQKEYGADKAKSIAWKQNTIEKALGFPLRLVKEERRSLQIWEADIYKRLWKLCQSGKIAEPEIELVHDTALKRPLYLIMEIINLVPAAKAIRYLESEKHDAVNPYLTYRDYLNDCVALKLDLSNSQVQFPKDLRKAHQETIRMVQYEKNAAERTLFAKVVRRLKKFSHTANGYIIRPAADAVELIDEGKRLHHCVGGYASRMAKGETAIFFIRREDSPDTSFYTLELRGVNVIQCRTLNNKSYEAEPEIKAFVDNWLNTVVRKGGKACRKKAA